MIGHPPGADFVNPSEKILEEQPRPSDSYSDMGRASVPADSDLKLWSIAITAILFIMKVRSEIRGRSAWGFAVLCEAGPAKGILLSAAACANICTPVNNRTGTSNRI